MCKWAGRLATFRAPGCALSEFRSCASTAAMTPRAGSNIGSSETATNPKSCFRSKPSDQSTIIRFFASGLQGIYVGKENIAGSVDIQIQRLDTTRE